MESGVKQGDPLSAALFGVVLDVIIEQLDLRGSISTHLKQCSAYADDILITAITKQSLIDTFQKLKDKSVCFGLIVYEQKTKHLRCSEKKNCSE